jgi:hypothetical protein
MRSLSLALAATLAALSHAQAQTHMDAGGTVVPGTFDVSNATRAPAYCQIAVTTTATSLAALIVAAGCPAIQPWAGVAYLTPESSATIALRWRADGIAPTASVGDPIFGNTKDPSVLGYNAIVNAALISATGASVVVDVRIGG